MRKVFYAAYLTMTILLVFSSCQKAPFLTLDGQKSLTFKDAGGSAVVSFTCNRAWSASSSADWLQISPSLGKASESRANVSITCGANDTFNSRTATVTISYEDLTETISVSQDSNYGFKPSQDSFILTDAAQSIEVEVKANVEYAVAIDPACEGWISQAGTKALTSTTYIFNVAENNDYDGREGVITISESGSKPSSQPRVITVKQAQKDAIVAACDSYRIGQDGGVITVKLGHNVDYSVEYDCNWITPTGTKAFTEEKLAFSIALNDSGEERTGTISFYSKDRKTVQKITVNQSAIYADGILKNLSTYSDIPLEKVTELQFVTGSDITSEKFTKERGCHAIYGQTEGTVLTLYTKGDSFRLVGTINGNFHQLYSVNNLDLRALDTSELTSMSSMFSGCISLKSLDLSSFKTSSADNAAYMFYNCQSLESLDISGFDLSGINKMSMMFFAAGDYAPALRVRCSSATKKAIISTGASCNPSRTIWDLTDGWYELYRSTDFSMDGQVRQLQKATRGAGINLIIMGDAFSDRLINDGRYDYYISQAVDAFFDTEPYSSLRDMFNVFEVYAVSDNEEYGNSSTAFQCIFDAGRAISGNLSKIEEYASKAVGTADFDDIVIAVVLNARIWAGCACFFVPSNVKYGCGDGLSIAYIPINESDSDFKDTFRHEVCGHAFAKLADEYVEYTGTYPDYMKKALATYEKYGWSKNIDITSDKTAVKWTRFLFDSRYAPQGLGVFEGAGYYHYGVWRPTESSIMKDNSAGYFNAPSREAIYIRANKLAFGSGWEYDYETFVEQDLRTYGKSKQSRATRSMDLPERHTAQPIVVEKRY